MTSQNPLMLALLEGTGEYYAADNTKISVRKLFERDGQPLPTPTTGSPADAKAVQKGTAGSPTPAYDAADRYIMLYFSAHWCPPCRAFTPHLSKVYRTLKQQGKDVEIIFCSLDRKRQEYDEYAGTMPFARLGFQDPRSEKLMRAVGAQFIPTLAVFRASDGKMINSNAKNAVASDSEVTAYPWPYHPPSPAAFGKAALRFVLFLGILYVVGKHWFGWW
jgi:thiol-disulfide isomerase/thioredoxin